MNLAAIEDMNRKFPQLSDKIGEQLTTHVRSIADENPLLKGIIDRVDFNATTHGVPRSGRRPSFQSHRAHQRKAPRSQ